MLTVWWKTRTPKLCHYVVGWRTRGRRAGTTEEIVLLLFTYSTFNCPFPLSHYFYTLFFDTFFKILIKHKSITFF